VANLYWLDRIESSDLPLVGSKAFNLSQLLQLGYPVVPGLVIPAIAFWDLIEELGESEPLLKDLPNSSFHIDVDNPHQLQQVAQQIRYAIASASLPSDWVAALSTISESLDASALILHPSLWLKFKQKQNDYPILDTHPQRLARAVFPIGILDTHTCLNQSEALLLAVKRVWSELFRARSLFYWQRRGIEFQQVNLAILVQPIWEASTSGNLEADLTDWKIQATWGIGESLAKGEVLPDSYQLQVDTGAILSSFLGHKTRAYRLSHGQELKPHTDRGLQAYFLSEEQQSQYALNPQYLNQLITLSQQLAAELTQTYYLEWAICQPPKHGEPQLYITQFVPHERVLSTHNLMSTSSPSPTPSLTPQIFRGLPAASGQVTALAHVLSGENKNLETILPGRILVSRSISPEWLPWLKTSAGFITEQGGITCHAAILARELGIPAVVNATGVTQILQNNEVLFVDGDQGEIHRLGYQNNLDSGVAEKPSTSTGQSSVFFRSYPIATQLYVNLSQPKSLERIVGSPVDGVGLLRSELMVLDALDNYPLNAWLRQGRSSELATRLAHLILQFATTFAPRPVFYRSLDWRSHDLNMFASSAAPSESEPEINPIIGRRGTLRYLDDPACFDVELEALAQVQSYGLANVYLMLPFVRTVEEFTFCRQRVEQAGLMANPHFQLWIMAEVPSVLFLVADYVKAGVQGISIGTNDLTQLILATDRDQGQLGSHLNSRHPAVLRALQQLIEATQQAGIPCSICGQAPMQYPDLIDLLIQWGITSISVDINDVERTYEAIARAEQRLLLEAARRRLRD
jgi:pyruvate,water dikinase